MNILKGEERNIILREKQRRKLKEKENNIGNKKDKD
jgi:hypothetical protein